MNYVRRYGVLIFSLPVVIYWIDAAVTGWHHAGTETVREIVWENLFEDAVAFSCFYVWVSIVKPLVAYLNDPRAYHCACPHCGYKWMVDPRDIPDRCPRCKHSESGVAP